METFSDRLVISSRCAKTIYNQRRSLALAAAAAGWNVVLAGDQDPDDPYPSRLNALGFSFEYVPVEQSSLSPFSMARLFVSYFKLFRRVRPSIFHAYTIKPIVVGLLAAKAAGVPVRMATIAGLGHLFLTRSRLKRWLGIFLLKTGLGQAQRVDFYNLADRDLFISLRIVRPSQARLTSGGSGVDIDRFRPSARTDDSGPFRVIFVGRLLREKGIEELLAAARALKEGGDDVVVEIVGAVDRDNPSSIAQAAIEAAQSRGEVVWHGDAVDVRPAVRVADAVVLPSYREGIPMVLLEAAAMGKPAITTDAPGCRDVVQDGETGLVVPVGNSAALREAILALARDRKGAATMGEKARGLAVSRFATEKVTSYVLTEYANLQASGRASE